MGFLKVVFTCFLFLVSGAIYSFGQEKLSDVKRVVFLGDSITHAGGYISLIELAVRQQHPETEIELLNLGLPSETVSGLSEPGHAGGAFPRPDLHERLDRVLEQTKPDLVVACYGMNDGIYYPLGKERFEKFKDGMERLHIAVEKQGAKIIHLTPAFFDALPIKDRLLPEGLEEYRQPYRGYDDVLEEYSAWLLEKREAGWVVLDLHGTMKTEVFKRREENPNFTFAGDGVHPNEEGQAVIAVPLAEYWGLKLTDISKGDEKLQESLRLISQKQNTLKLAWLSATKHVRPGIANGLPLDEATKRAAEMDQKVKALLGKKA